MRITLRNVMPPVARGVAEAESAHTSRGPLRHHWLTEPFYIDVWYFRRS